MMEHLVHPVPRVNREMSGPLVLQDLLVYPVPRDLMGPQVQPGTLEPPELTGP